MTEYTSVSLVIPEEMLPKFSAAMRAAGFKKWESRPVTIKPREAAKPSGEPAKKDAQFSLFPPKGRELTLEEVLANFVENAPPVTEGGDAFPATPPSNGTQCAGRSPRYAYGIKNKSIRGYDLAFDVIYSEDRPWSTEELAKVFAEHKFKRGSCTGALSHLYQEGLIDKPKKGWYRQKKPAG